MLCAVVGCGYWGRHYVRILAGRGRCAWAVDADPAARARIAAAYPAVNVAANAAAALADPAVGAMIVVTPAATHHDVVRRALLAGKHVLVEKPLTLDPEHADALVALAAAQGRALMVGHTFLFNSRLWKLAEVMRDAHRFGELRYVATRRTNLGPVRSDCSVLWDLAPHDVSIVLALQDGRLPVRVSATGQSVLANSTHVDVAFVTLHFPDNNTIAHIHVSWCDPHKVREVVAVGSKMRATFSDMDATRPVQLMSRSVNVDPQNQERSIFSDGDILIPRIVQSEPLSNQVDEFLRQCSAAEEKGPCPAAAAAAAADVTTAEPGSKKRKTVDAAAFTAAAAAEATAPAADAAAVPGTTLARGPGDLIASMGALGAQVVKILYAAEKSVAAGGAPVELAWG